ncbi:sodium:dicarboxylate symporter family protein [Burkholderia pseudomallei]|nr:sodium:dicarboxylate symporter family protein [Burkholderia pseudomallei]
MKKRRNITSYIVIAMILGIAVGYGCHSAFPDPAIAKEIAGYVSLLSDVFLRLIKMIIAPLVFATLTVGIAHMGDTGAVGRVGVKALGWFFIASFTSLLLGLLAATLLQPGSHLSLPLPATDAAVNLKTSAFTLKDFVIHLVPIWCRSRSPRRWRTTRSCRSSCSRSSSARRCPRSATPASA